MSDNTIVDNVVIIVAAQVATGPRSANEITTLIRETYAALDGLGKPAEGPVPTFEPAVPIRSSVKPDYLVCLEDGKKMKMLKRYLMTNYQMTPEQYRAKWKLPADYPMVAANYADKRRKLAKKHGLGLKSPPTNAG